MPRRAPSAPDATRHTATGTTHASRRAVLAAATTALGGLGALAGCSILTGRSPSLEPTGDPIGPVAGSHPQYQYDAANSGYNPTTAQPGGPVRAQWAVDTGSAYPTPWALADDTLYATVADGTVLALATATGEELWRRDATGSPALAVAVSDGQVVVTDEKGVTGRATADGRALWSEPAAGLTGVAPTVADDTYLGGRTPMALEPDGAVRWRYDRGAGGDAGAPFETAAVANGGVYLSRPGELVAINAESGEERWRHSLPSDPDGFEGRPTPPAVGARGDGDTEAPELVYVGGPFGVVCVDADGERRWHRDVGPIAGLAVTPDRVVAGAAKAEIARQNASGMLFVLDPDSGGTLWQATDTEPGIGYGVPFVVGDSLFGGAARLAVQDVADGDIRWVLGAQFERLLVLDGAVFLGTADGTLYGCR